MRLFTGNYGSALGNYGQAAQLQAQAGANIGQALEGVSQTIAGALEKHEQDKAREEIKPLFMGQMESQGVKRDAAEKAWSAVSKNPGHLNTIGQVITQSQQLQQMQQSKELHGYIKSQQDYKTQAMERENNLAISLQGIRNKLKEKGLIDEANKLDASITAFNLGGGATGAAQRKREEERLDLAGKRLAVEQLEAQKQEQQEGDLISDTTAALVLGQEPGPVAPRILNQASVKAKQIEAEFQKMDDANKNVESLIKYRSDYTKAQEIAAYAKLSSQSREELKRLRQEQDDLMNERISVVHKGKQQWMTAKEIQEAFDKGDLPEEYKKSTRWQKHIGLLESNRMQIDKQLIQGMGVFETDDDDAAKSEAIGASNKKLNPSDFLGGNELDEDDPTGYLGMLGGIQ